MRTEVKKESAENGRNGEGGSENELEAANHALSDE